MTTEEKEKLISQIAFEERWLCDVLHENEKISTMDIKIAMDGIRNTIKHFKEVDE